MDIASAAKEVSLANKLEHFMKGDEEDPKKATIGPHSRQSKDTDQVRLFNTSSRDSG